MKNSLLFCFVLLLAINRVHSQKLEIVGLELAKPPSNFQKTPYYNFGTKLTFFVQDTSQVTGLISTYEVKDWITDTGKDLKLEHRQLALQAVALDYRMAKDTALLTQRGFWLEKGKGFTLKLHSWALPAKGDSFMVVKGTVGYTTLDQGEVQIEDITHLAGNFGFESMRMDVKGNTITLKKVVYGKGEDAYSTFKGNLRNNSYAFAIQKMEFLDSTGKVTDELYFGFKNEYSGASTRNRVDLTTTSKLRIYYQKLQTKKIVLSETFGLGF